VSDEDGVDGLEVVEGGCGVRRCSRLSLLLKVVGCWLLVVRKTRQLKTINQQHFTCFLYFSCFSYLNMSMNFFLSNQYSVFSKQFKTASWPPWTDHRIVENIGVEPMTSCVQGRRSSQLS
jgi:hypothetical protein